MVPKWKIDCKNHAKNAVSILLPNSFIYQNSVKTRNMIIPGIILRKGNKVDKHMQKKPMEIMLIAILNDFRNVSLSIPASDAVV